MGLTGEPLRYLGKTRWVVDLLTHPDSSFDKVLYYYSLWQPLYDELKDSGIDVEFAEGLPAEAPPFDQNKSTCFIFDDLMDKVAKSEWASKLYMAGWHHQNVSIITLQQNVFTSREQRLQCHYLVLWDFPQDSGAMEPLARQLCPGKVAEFREMYRDATDPDHG